MNPSRRTIAVITVGTLGVLAACGGESGPIAAEDDPVEQPDAAASDGASATTAGVSDGGSSPVATVSPDLAPELVGVVGPVSVFGNALVPLTGDSIDGDPARDVQAPVVAGEDFDGRTVRIDAIAGGPTMVVFLAHWCPHCNDEIPVLNGLRDARSFPAGLNIVAVSTAVSAGRPNFPPDAWLDRMDWTYPVIADGIDLEHEVLIAADAFGVTGFPFVVLIDGDGTVQARWSGNRPAEEIIRLVESNLTFG